MIIEKQLARLIRAIPHQLSVHGAAVTQSWSWRPSSSAFNFVLEHSLQEKFILRTLLFVGTKFSEISNLPDFH